MVRKTLKTSRGTTQIELLNIQCISRTHVLHDPVDLIAGVELAVIAPRGQLLTSESSERQQPRDALAEVPENRRHSERVESLQLTRGRDVDLLHYQTVFGNFLKYKFWAID